VVRDGRPAVYKKKVLVESRQQCLVSDPPARARTRGMQLMSTQNSGEL
jgi:hypothetical protein